MFRIAILSLFSLMVACDEGPPQTPTPNPAQTVCGNGYCESAGETYGNCPADCTRCGDGVCNAEESPSTCSLDCDPGLNMCGNGTCDFAESQASCPADCTSVGGCTSHTQCDFDEFCYQQQCQGVLGRSFRVTIESGKTATTKADGAGWDFGGGAPDLSVQFGIIDGKFCLTETNDDAFSAVWNVHCDFVFPSGGAFRVRLWDIDTADDDYVAGWLWEGSDALVGLARTGGAPYTLMGDRASDQVTLRVTPRF